ncbi:hypothetical protein [Leptospira sp. GIMC2001]|uniref:hypothetical protein n=1 Tax=Leptospira sp. GIMC2001 TaxID=1513297 RepID=UPI00234A5E7A|nr:hypothetical protein [Leptospira sp. GIMC2001]WCL49892.1 hypothetical protein O4O04_03480 [Leptospira sp. GIMC2001]
MKNKRIHFLERVFLALSRKEDFTLVTSKVPQALLNHWKEMKWEFGQPIYLDSQHRLLFPFDSSTIGSTNINSLHADLSHVDSLTEILPNPDSLDRDSSVKKLSDLESFGLELIEFGSIKKWDNGSLIVDEKTWQSAAFLNSKINQTNYSNEIGFSEAKMGVVRSLDDVADILENRSQPTIFKQELGGSGKGHRVWKSAKDGHKLKTLSFPAVYEDYSETRFYDFGVLLDWKPEGIEFIAISEIQIGKEMNFRSCLFYLDQPPKDLIYAKDFVLNEKKFIDNWKNFSDDQHPYKGAVAVDGFLAEDGLHRARSEINFRYSMGRIAWEIHAKRVEQSNYRKPSKFGLVIKHKSEDIEQIPDYKLFLSISEQDPYQVVYIEYY